MQDFSFLPASWRCGLGRHLVLGGLLAAAPFVARAQAPTGGVGIGTTAPDVSAALDIVSSSKGALLPRVADATAIATPATGLLVFQTGGTPGFYYNAGTPAAPSWQQLATASGAAVTASNGLTKTGQNITLGGTLTQATDVATNGNNFTLSGAGNVGIGTSTPTQKLDVAGSGVLANQLRVDGSQANTGTFPGFSSGNPQPDLFNGLLFGDDGSGEGIGSSRSGTTNVGGLDFYTYYTPRLRITNGGSVGIGTSTPRQRLEVAGQVYSSTGGFRFPDNTVQATAGLTGNSAILNQTSQQANSNFNISGNGTVGGTLTAANVGIGTTSPNGQLANTGVNTLGIMGPGGQPAGGNAISLNWAGSQAGYIGQFYNGGTTSLGNGVLVKIDGTDGGAIALDVSKGTQSTAATSLLLVKASGNVGIGTANPGQKLEVAGQVFSSSGGFRFPDNTVQATAATDAQALSINGSTLSLTNGGSVTVPGDNLGNHTATQNLNLASFRLTGNGSTEGYTIASNGFLRSSSLNTALVGGTVSTGATGSGNALLGLSTGGSLTSGANNTLLGAQAGFGLTTGLQNVLVGLNAGFALVGGTNNSAVGAGALDNTTSGGANTALGFKAGTTNTTGNRVTLLGAAADVGAAGLTNATAVGAGAVVGQSNTVVLGNNANVGIGTSTPGQKLEVAGGIKFTGTGSVLTFPDGTTQATAATAGSAILNQTSQQAGSNFNVDGNGTVGGTLTAANAVVSNALTGNGGNIGSVVGLGVRADGGLNIGQNTSGSNIALGYAAGAVSTGLRNQFIGYAAGSGSTAGNNNAFSGYASGNANTTGGYNTFEGAFSGNGNTGGNFNAFFGAAAGVYNTIGSNNTVVGAYSGPAQGSGALDNATAIGANVTLTTSNTVVLGNNANVGIGTPAPAAGLHVLAGNSGVSSGTGVLISGPPTGIPNIELRGGSTAVTPYIDFAETNAVDFTTRLRSIGGVLNVEGNGSSAAPAGLLFRVNGGVQATNVTYTSDARFKTHVRPLAGALASVLALRGVRYEWNALGVQHGGTAGAGQVGLLAQELEKVYPELVSTDAQGYKSVNYAQLAPVLIEALKEQQRQLETLQARAAAAEAKATAALETFEARLRRLEAGAAPDPAAQARH